MKGYMTDGSDHLVKDQSPAKEHERTFSAASEQHCVASSLRVLLSINSRHRLVELPEGGL